MKNLFVVSLIVLTFSAVGCSKKKTKTNPYAAATVVTPSVASSSGAVATH